MYSEKTSIKILLNNWVFVIFGLRAEKFGRSDEKPFVGLSKLHSTSAEEQFLDVSLEGTKFAQAFCSLSEIIGLFVWIFLSSLSELQPTCAADHFEVSLERRVIVWAFLVAERKYPIFGRKSLAGLLKLYFTCPEEQFQDIFSEWKHFWRMKITRRIVKTTFNVFKGTVSGRFSGMMKLCSSFLSVERNYWTFSVNFLSSLSELQPTCAADHFEDFLQRRVIVWAFLVAERKYPIFGRKNLAGLLKLYFTCPEEQFQDIFSEWKHFWRMKNTRRIVKTTFNVFKGTVSGRFSGMMKLCTSFLVVVERNSSNLAWKFWQICQNCSLRVQRNISRFFGEKSNCLSVFGFWAKASEFWQKKIGRVAKTTFYVSRGTISGHFFWNEIFLKDKKHS